MASLASAPVAFAGAPAVTSAHVVRVSAPAPAPAPESARYAAREHTDRAVEKFEGGAVMIVASGGAVLLALVLLVLLV